MNILADITSRDPEKIWSASCEIRKLRDEKELAKLSRHIAIIKESTSGINLGGGFFPNSKHLEFALIKLEFVKNREGCLCGLYPFDIWYEPSKEQELGFVNIMREELIENKWIDFYICQCVKCGSKFKVIETTGHFTCWQWGKI